MLFMARILDSQRNGFDKGIVDSRITFTTFTQKTEFNSNMTLNANKLLRAESEPKRDLSDSSRDSMDNILV